MLLLTSQVFDSWVESVSKSLSAHGLIVVAVGGWTGELSGNKRCLLVAARHKNFTVLVAARLLLKRRGEHVLLDRWVGSVERRLDRVGVWRRVLHYKSQRTRRSVTFKV